MASTTLQNCQRIIILMQFATVLAVIFFLTIRLIKKKIDLTRPEEEDEKPDTIGAKYKEQQPSRQQFQKKAENATVFTQNDTCTERFMKKICEYNVIFNPLLITLPLNFVLGRSMALSVSLFFISACACFIFNVFKVHRACIQFKLSRLFLQIIWIVVSVLLLVNIWLTPASSMPYLIRSK